MAVPNGVLNELPITIPRSWDTAWGSTGGARHEGRPQAVITRTGDTYMWVFGNMNRVDDINGTTYTCGNMYRYNRTTGALDTSWLPIANGQVLWASLSADESTIFIVGEFTSIDGTTRNYMAGITASTGALSSHFSGFACNASVDTCVIDSTSLYVGGHFTSIGGVTRNRAAKLSVATTTVTVDGSWNPNCSQPVVRNDLCIDSGTHKIAMNLDPQGTVGGSGQHSVALVNATTGAKYWGVNPTPGGGYVMRANDDHNGGQIYLGTRGAEGNRLYAFSYAGVEQWWFRGNGDIQGVGFWRGLVVAAKHDSMCAAVKNSSSYTQIAGGVFIVNKDGVLQPAPWRSRFTQGGAGFGVLRCFGAWGFLESDFACLVMTGEFGAVSNFAGTQSKSPAPWRIAQFNEGGTTTPPGSHGWDVGYWDGDYWGGLAGQTQSVTVTVPPNGVGQFAFAGVEPVVSATVEGADALVFAQPGTYFFTAAVPEVSVEVIGAAEVVAPAAAFSFAGPQVSVQSEISVNVLVPAAARFRFGGADHGVTTASVTVTMRRRRSKLLEDEVVQGRVIR